MATVAEVDIVNTALGLLGQEPVVDLSDASLQQSNAAVKLLRVLDVARDVVLRRHGWTCALEYVTLAPADLPGYVNFRYPFVYLLPGDALRVWEIAGVAWSGDASCWAPRWQVGSTEVSGSPQLIVRASPLVVSGPGGGDPDSGWQGWSAAPSSSDPLAQIGSAPVGMGPLNVVYVRRAGFGALDPHVADAVAVMLAARAAYSVTGDMNKQTEMRKEAEMAILLAVSAEGTQEGNQPPWAGSIPAAIRDYAR